MIEELDKSVGSVVEKLAFSQSGKGYSSSSSDNGQSVGSINLRGHKGTIWEGGHRVPAFVCQPGVIAPGQRCAVPVISLDLFPTILSAADFEIPADVKPDGIDLMPLMTENHSVQERTLFWEHGNQRAVRKGPWKLVASREEGELKLELFNLDDDLLNRRIGFGETGTGRAAASSETMDSGCAFLKPAQRIFEILFRRHHKNHTSCRSLSHVFTTNQWIFSTLIILLLSTVHPACTQTDLSAEQELSSSTTSLPPPLRYNCLIWNPEPNLWRWL